MTARITHHTLGTAKHPLGSSLFSTDEQLNTVALAQHLTSLTDSVPRLCSSVQHTFIPQGVIHKEIFST